MSMNILNEINTFTGNEIEKKPFEVKDITSAEWALNKALEAEKRIQERINHAEELKKRIDSWLLNENAKDTDTVSFMSGLLKPYAEEQVSKLKANSIKLVSGSFGFRKNPDSVNIINEEFALQDCQIKLPDAIKVKYSLEKAKLKTAIESGMQINGVEIKKGDNNFFLKET